MHEADKDGDNLLVLKAVREAKGVVEMLARIHGLLQSDGAVVVDQRSVTVNAPELPEEDMRAIIAMARGLPASEKGCV